MTNEEILKEWLASGLLKRCLQCQFAKLKDYTYYEDYAQDLCLTIMEYDNKKLNDAYNKHPNAFITRIIQNNIFSVNSPYYMRYKRWDEKKYGVPLADDDESYDNEWD